MSSSNDKSKGGRSQNSWQIKLANKKNRHRFNRASDIADDIAAALYSRDPAHRDNPDNKKRLSRINNRIDDRSQGYRAPPAAILAADESNSTERRSSSAARPQDPEVIARIWDTCCSKCLGLNSTASSSHTTSVRNTPDSGSDQASKHPHQALEAVGAQLVWIDADEAVVYAQSPIWATRVRMLAPSLVACMRQSGLNEISRLRVRVEPAETVSIPRARPMVPMTPESGEILSQAADRSRDDDLAGRLKRLARHAQKKD